MELGKKLRFMRLSLGVLLLVVISVVIRVPSVVLAQQNDATSSISDAQSTLIQCYDAARAAEVAGANISQLTGRLNIASLLLSRAELANSNGYFSLAESLAVESQDELASFVSEANSLQFSAQQSRSSDFWLNIVGSSVETVAVLVGSLTVWVLLKRKYGINNGVQQVESNAV
jgi:hypothetical protein